MKNITKKILSLLLFQFLVFYSFSNTQQIVFEQFPLSDKLPSNSVTRTFQDKDGYVWFGTKDGLCRFDGYDVKIFRSSAKTPGKLTNNEIESIVEDNNGKLWIGTLEGVNTLDKRNFSIKPFKNKYTENGRINYITCDRNGFIWISVANIGLLKVNPNNDEYELLTSAANSRIRLNNNNVSQIYEDRNGNIWLTFWKGGVMCLDKESEKVLVSDKIGPNNNPFRIFQDNDGLYWVLTWGDGIYHMTLDSRNMLNIFRPKLVNSSNAIDNIVYSIVQDNKFGHIWVISFNGLYIFQKQESDIYKIIDGKSFVKKTSGEIFHDIYNDSFGNLWLGSLADGAYRLNLMNFSFENYPIYDVGESVKSFVTHLCQANSGNIYVALDRKGLFKFNISDGSIENLSDSQLKGLKSISAITYIAENNEFWIANEGTGVVYIFTENGNELTFKRMFSLTKSIDNLIRTIFEDAEKNVWIGANTGLYKVMSNNIVEFYKLYNINTIGQDSDGNIWVGTDKEGLFQLKKRSQSKDEKSYEIKEIELRINDHLSKSIQSIHCRSNGDVYIGTKEGCIYYFDKKNNTINDISGQFGITEEKILDLLEDEQDNLWISTIKRVIRFNMTTNASTYYSTSNGVLISSFNKDSKLKLKSGNILFGGNNGICSFNPVLQQSALNQQKKTVLLTDIFINDKSVFDLDLSKTYDSKKNRLTLKYKDNNVGIEFSALDYRSANNIQYAYKLAGITDDWNYVGNNRRFLNYADLPFGNYVFMVRSSDENGVWSDDITTMSIHILPPFYRTWWAYLLYILALVVLGIVLYRGFANRIRLRNDLKISRIEKEKTEELAQTKLRFFTNITHELLTPITIAMLEIEKLQNNGSSKPAHFNVITESVNRLRRLIEQILYFRKAESGNFNLKVTKGDIITFIEKIVIQNFKTLYNDKGINLSFFSDKKSYIAYFDADKLDKVIYNLMSNAYKHTNRGGNVDVTVEISQKDDLDYLNVFVSDNGNGIAESDLPFIFDRFYITSTSDQSQSHGIGLALTKDLISIHKGSISVKSKLKEGTTFEFEIPISPVAFTEDEIYRVEEEIVEEKPENPDVIQGKIKQKTDTDDSKIEKEFTILIVEDNKDLREIMSDNLSRFYHVLAAENGVLALDLIHKNDVDIIISDIMMPEMDGLSLCRLIKNDIKTSHLSVLVLTAKDSPQDRIDSYEAGADGYISKPFEMEVLEARVKNLIYSRSKRIEQFQQNYEVNITNIEYNSTDEEFLKLAIKKVEEKLSDEKYDFEQFAMDMSSSKSTLHRKLKSLTGLSPWEFIRNIRLKHAAQMLKNNVGNISEIAFKVGFNDPKYFSRCFKTEFGINPKEFQDSHKEE